MQSAGPLETASRRSCSERGAEVVRSAYLSGLEKGNKKDLGTRLKPSIWLK